jgi:hypothetical protein
MRTIEYALLCLILPIAWGLLIYWASSVIEKRINRRRKPGETAEPLRLDYHI